MKAKCVSSSHQLSLLGVPLVVRAIIMSPTCHDRHMESLVCNHVECMAGVSGKEGDREKADEGEDDLG